MDRALKAGVKKYLKQIQALLLCDGRTARHFLSDLKNDILNYIEDGNVQSMDDVIANFGDPETVARSFLETANIRKIKKRMRIVDIILYAVLAAVLLLAVCVVSLWIDAARHSDIPTFTAPPITLEEHTAADRQ